jgi:hypothetical protein
MPAVQVGPNAIAVELGGAAVLATSWNIPATTGTLSLRRPPLTAVNAIAATAVQVSPADTRYVIT